MELSSARSPVPGQQSHLAISNLQNLCKFLWICCLEETTRHGGTRHSQTHILSNIRVCVGRSSSQNQPLKVLQIAQPSCPQSCGSCHWSAPSLPIGNAEVLSFLRFRLKAAHMIFLWTGLKPSTTDGIALRTCHQPTGKENEDERRWNRYDVL